MNERMNDKASWSPVEHYSRRNIRFDVEQQQQRNGTKVRRYNSHSAGSLGWPFSTQKYQQAYIFQINHTEAILSNGTRRLLWFEISKMPIAV